MNYDEEILRANRADEPFRRVESSIMEGYDPLGNLLRVSTIHAECPYPCTFTLPHPHSLIDSGPVVVGLVSEARLQVERRLLAEVKELRRRLTVVVGSI